MKNNQKINGYYVYTESGKPVEINSFHYFIFKLVASQKLNYNLAIFLACVSSYLFCILMLVGLCYENNAWILFLSLFILASTNAIYLFIKKNKFIKSVKIYSAETENKTADEIPKEQAPLFVRSFYKFLRRRSQIVNACLAALELFLAVFIILINVLKAEKGSFIEMCRNFQWIIILLLVLSFVLHLYSWWSTKRTKTIIEYYWSNLNQLPGWKTSVLNLNKKKKFK